jgi:hypothetical protein
LAQASYFPRPLWACIVAAGGMAAPANGAYAVDGRDCRAINQGYLTVQVSPNASSVRNAVLAKGDVVAFTIAAGAGGYVSLISGRRLLFAGPRGARKSFTASRSGKFAFRFATNGDGAVAFTASCTPSAVAAARIAEGMDLGDLPEMESERPLIDPEPPPSAPPAVANLDEGTSKPAKAEAGSPQSPIQWEGTRSGAAPSGTTPDAEAGSANVGVKLKVQPAIMVGVVAQFDQAQAALPALSDRSWVAGPVTSLQLGAGTSLDARATWGPLETDAATGSHGADRRLMDARLTNKQELGAWRFSPSVGLNYAQDRAPVAGPDPLALQKSETGRVDVRPELAYRIDMDHAMFIEPKVMVGPFWDVGDKLAPAPGTPGHTDARLKAETGITIGTTNGTKLQIGGGVEEGGPNALNTWSGRLRIDVPLK